MKVLCAGLSFVTLQCGVVSKKGVARIADSRKTESPADVRHA